MSISAEVRVITEDYAMWLSDRFGMNTKFMFGLGLGAKPILDAEFTMHGTDMYRLSVVLPVRNLIYGSRTLDSRADLLDTLKLVEPIYDHGCGVGLMLLYLKYHGGYSDLWGWDVPGVQSDLASEYLSLHGIKWGKPDHPGTVSCNNVLEHMASPMSELTSLRAMGGNLMANCCDSEDIDHISSVADRLVVIESLRAEGQWCDYTKGSVLSWA